MCVAKVLLAKRNTEKFEHLKARLDGYALERVEDPDALVERLRQFEPDVLILGAGMPLPQAGSLSRPPVVIGLEQPADLPENLDFLQCDFDAVPDAVHKAFVERHKTAGCPAMALLSLDLDSTRGAAFSSMKSAGELGIVLGFYRQASLANDALALAQLVRQTVHDFTEQVQVMILGGEGWIYLQGENRGELFGQCSILERLKHKPRVFEAGGRSFVNYPKAIIAWQTPADTAEAGRLRDLLAYVAEGASNQAAAIASRDAIIRSRNVAFQSATALRGLMQQLESDVQAHRGGFEDKLNEFLSDIVHRVRRLSISDKEKADVADLCRDSIERIMDGFDRAEHDLDVLESVIDELEKDFVLHAADAETEAPSETQQVTLF